MSTGTRPAPTRPTRISRSAGSTIRAPSSTPPTATTAWRRYTRRRSATSSSLRAVDPAGSIRSFALSFPQAREDHPFGPESHVFKVGGGSTMFAILGDGPPVSVTLKLTREEREVALEMPYVSEARYVGRYGWITARIEDEDCLEATLEWMRESYWLKAPEDVREAAWA